MKDDEGSFTFSGCLPKRGTVNRLASNNAICWGLATICCDAGSL